MLHKVTSTYGEIARFFPELRNKLPSSAHKKQTLLDMAERGEKKPGIKTALGRALSSYTIKSSPAQDPDFTKKIRGLRPDWFVSKTERSDQKKRLLLEAARKGRPKPKRNTPLGIALKHYTLKSSQAHDPSFTKEIKRLRPDWLLSNSQRADQKKRMLLEKARKGEPRPGRKTPLEISLACYMSKSHNSYDPDFAKQIKRLAPDWFRKCSTR